MKRNMDAVRPGLRLASSATLATSGASAVSAAMSATMAAAVLVLAGCGGGGGGGDSTPAPVSTGAPGGALAPVPAPAPAQPASEAASSPSPVVAAPAPAPAASAADTTPRPMTWTQARWGGGGYVTGVMFHPALRGLAYARTDVGGLYRRDPGSTAWIPLNDDLGRADADLQGVFSMAVDPADPDKVYIATGMYLPDWAHLAAVFRSTDRGATWQRTDLPIRLGGNSDGRGAGERLAVDPLLGSVLFLGTNQDGLYKSTDSGATWTKVPGFAPSSVSFVMFDPGNRAPGSATPTLYAGIASTTGSTLYHSTDGGANWTAISGGPSGLMPQRAALASDGQLYVTYGNGPGPNGVTNGAVWKLDTGTLAWRNVTPSVPNPSGIAFGYAGVSVSKANPRQVIVSTLDRWSMGDDLYRSSDGGLTWTALAASSKRTADRHAWMTALEGGSLDGRVGHWITDVQIDPFDPDHALYNTGAGIWETGNLTAATLNWTPGVDGLEETCITGMVSPREGAHLMATMGDVGGVRYDTDFSDNRGYFPSHSSGTSVDVAEQDPNVAVYTAFKSGSAAGGFLSRDNGVSWSPMSASPVPASQSDPGLIAISAKGTAIVWVPARASASYSIDGGKTWTASTGYPTATDGFSADFPRPVADRAVDGVFYTYDSATGRLLESADNGKTFTAIATGLDVLPSYAATHRLVSIPGAKRRDLWLATPNGLTHVDGVSAAPSKVAGVDVAYALGYGAPAAGQTYPALYLAGTVKGSYGLWRSDDRAATWTRLSDARHQFGSVGWITGDARIPGRVYLGTGCRGVIVGDP
ncbi:WD40/YVTN/BNR-like repeat-containing protein [Roseateles sp. MS654]|uniref:WD40/YVTN/BNR-like repeat-containing protein n=1 Tax=Roseateles sp. MS654 TaxID=3412685 RepID=UPI003C2EF9E6